MHDEGMNKICIRMGRKDFVGRRTEEDSRVVSAQRQSPLLGQRRRRGGAGSASDPHIRRPQIEGLRSDGDAVGGRSCLFDGDPFSFSLVVYLANGMTRTKRS